MDYAALLYDPIYETFGMPAAPTPNRQGAASVTVTVIAELDGGTLTLGGRTWRIESHAPRFRPDGETSGEVLMCLIEAADA